MPADEKVLSPISMDASEQSLQAIQRMCAESLAKPPTRKCLDQIPDAFGWPRFRISGSIPWGTLGVITWKTSGGPS